jgi:CheY-like chemotaxis protein
MSNLRVIRPPARRAGAACVPILAMTANAFAEDTQRALGAGMNAHIVKPINVDVMLSTIASCVAAARQPTLGDSHWLQLSVTPITG